MIKEVYEIVKDGVNSISNVTKGSVVNDFRKLNKICVILDDDMIYPVRSDYHGGIRDVIRTCQTNGYVELEVFEEGEDYRFIPITRVKEYTLGSFSEHDGFFDKMYKKVENMVTKDVSRDRERRITLNDSHNF